MAVTEWNSDPKWPELFTTTDIFCTCYGSTNLLTSNSILILNELLYVLWRTCSSSFTFLLIQECWMQRPKMEQWKKEKQTCCLCLWMNGPLTVFWMILIIDRSCDAFGFPSQTAMSGLCVSVCVCVHVCVSVCVCSSPYCELCDECIILCILIGSSTWFYQVLCKCWIALPAQCFGCKECLSFFLI